MSLRFIYGRAGSGKSSYCIDQIKKKLDNNSDRELILLVPEQLSFQSEKRLIKSIGGLGIKNVRVLSFKRMAYTVFKEVGGIAKKRMNASGKSMLIYRIMDELKEELKIFKNASRQQGFIETISDILTEFKRYNVTPEILNDAKEKVNDNTLLYDKLSDINKIYSKFEELLHINYIDSDDDMTLLYNKLDECTIFNNSEIWIDEFDGFVPQQYRVIEKLIRKAREVNITVNMSFDDSRVKIDESDVFSPIRYTENKLRDLAMQNGISIEKEVILENNPCIRFKNNDDLAYLEQNYFKFPFKPYRKDVKNIGIYKAMNVYSEVEDAAKNILMLCRDKGVRFNEIAVVTRNLDNYEKIVKVVFTEYGIPHFIDKKKDITGNSIVVLILSALDVFIKNWSYESMFGYLKTGLVYSDKDSIDLLENYVLQSGIKGKKKWTEDILWYNNIIENFNLREILKETFTDINDSELTYENFIELFDVEDNFIENITKIFNVSLDLDSINIENLNQEEKNESIIELEQDLDKVYKSNEKIRFLINLLNDIKKINLVRNETIKDLISFKKKLRGRKTAKQITTYLFEFLGDINIINNLEELLTKFKEEDNLELVNEYSQIWNVVIELMDQIVEVIGDEELTLEQYVKILSAGFKQNEMGFIPTSLDQVIVSSVDRLKSHEVKYLYLMGVNDGVFPLANNDEGILSDADRIRLKQENMELAKDTKSKMFEEQFLIYKSLTISGEYLRLSYPIADFEGKSIRPSIIISRIKALFPNIDESSEIVNVKDKQGIMEDINTPTPTFNNFISALHEYKENECVDELWIDVYRWFKYNDEWNEKLYQVLNGFKYTNQVEKLSSDKARKIYGNIKSFSVSRLERYNECPFAYFVRYGLNAKERKIFNLSPPDIGTFMHSVIDKFSKAVDNNKLKWGELDKQWCDTTIEEKIEESMKETQGRIFAKSSKYRYFAERLKNVLSRAIWLIVEHMKRSGFEPFGYEIEFGNTKEGYPPIEIELSTGEKVKLIGKIDRADKLIFEDEEYFRIIDYKSGNKEFKLSDVYYGLQMQLLTYLDAILTSEDNINKYPVFPAGVLYFKIDDPMIKTSKRLSNEEIEKEIMKKLKMNGLVLANTEIIKEMDREIEGASLIIPAYVKKDGSIGSSSRSATREQFEQLRSHVKTKLIEACEEMLSGNIEIRPYKNKDKSPCGYCLYSSICEFDPLMNDNNYKLIVDKKDEEVWNLLEKKQFNKEVGDINE